jgi:hypothetical protein
VLLLAHPDLAEDRASRLADSFVTAIPRTTGYYESWLPKTWDTLEWAELASSSVGAARDSAYLDWRYRKHCCFEYRFVVLPEGSRAGVLVWRLETIRHQTEAGRVDVDRIGRVVEFLPVSAENARSLIACLICQLSNADALGADFFGYHGRTRSLLRDAGFKSCELEADASLIPSRFQPLDSYSGPTLNAMFAPPALPGCSSAQDCSWYWTKSDSDQDRPN